MVINQYWRRLIKAISLPLKTEKTDSILKRPPIAQLLLVLLPETNGLLQIIIVTICAFPEQNHIIAFKDQIKCYFCKMTPVAQW